MTSRAEDESCLAVAGRQRACRHYTDAAVDDAIITELLRVACCAPSSQNQQPWRFVVVRDDETRAAFGELMREIWERFGRRFSEGTLEPALFREVDEGVGGGGLAKAPVHIVVGGDSSVLDRSQLASSVFPAVQNLLLAATALGLGSCLTTIATLRADDVRALVGFPPEIDPLAIVPIGYPARPLGPPRRNPVESNSSRERYGVPWA
ncbi:MAG: nitroreductase family protein [Acidimicrobiales bacterium]|nr:nitroreductase family protein [Acidimicrobiales bacterium]